MIHYIRISEETQGIRRSVQKKVTYAGKHKKHRCEGREKTWQAGQRGTHFAFRAISAAAKTALCLSGAAPLKPFERTKMCGCAFLRNAWEHGRYWRSCSCFFSSLRSSLPSILSTFCLWSSSSRISSRERRYSAYAAFFSDSSLAYSSCKLLTVGSFFHAQIVKGFLRRLVAPSCSARYGRV